MTESRMSKYNNPDNIEDFLEALKGSVFFKGIVQDGQEIAVIIETNGIANHIKDAKSLYLDESMKGNFRLLSCSMDTIIYVINFILFFPNYFFFPLLVNSPWTMARGKENCRKPFPK